MRLRRQHAVAGPKHGGDHEGAEPDEQLEHSVDAQCPAPVLLPAQAPRQPAEPQLPRARPAMNADSTMEVSALVTPNCAMAMRSQTTSSTSPRTRRRRRGCRPGAAWGRDSIHGAGAYHRGSESLTLRLHGSFHAIEGGHGGAGTYRDPGGGDCSTSPTQTSCPSSGWGRRTRSASSWPPGAWPTPRTSP